MKHWYDATIIYAVIIVTVAVSPGIALLMELMK